MFSGLTKNREIRSGVRQIGNEYLKNDSIDFLQTRYVKTFLHVCLECISHLLLKIDANQNLVD